ncbi:hypothetical protein ACFLT4_06505, partial [Chloroflexota bacterium]
YNSYQFILFSEVWQKVYHLLLEIVKVYEEEELDSRINNEPLSVRNAITTLKTMIKVLYI